MRCINLCNTLKFLAHVLSILVLLFFDIKFFYDIENSHFRIFNLLLMSVLRVKMFDRINPKL